MNTIKEESFLIPAENEIIEVILEMPTSSPQGIVICTHPHPLYQGNMHNKVVYVLARCFRKHNYLSVRFNFRGVGRSSGHYDHGKGEIHDLLLVTKWITAQYPNLPLCFGGVSFGAFVLTHFINENPSIPYTLCLLLATPHTTLPCSEPPQNSVVIHGENDDKTSLKEILEWASISNTLLLQVVPKSSHLFDKKLHILSEFLMKYLNFLRN